MLSVVCVIKLMYQLQTCTDPKKKALKIILLTDSFVSTNTYKRTVYIILIPAARVLIEKQGNT
jgi:ABC-type uncharacterized transport system auxiliary subunit